MVGSCDCCYKRFVVQAYVLSTCFGVAAGVEVVGVQPAQDGHFRFVVNYALL